MTRLCIPILILMNADIITSNDRKTGVNVVALINRNLFTIAHSKIRIHTHLYLLTRSYQLRERILTNASSSR